MAVNTWIAEEAGDASTDAKWSLGRAPIAGDDVEFRSESSNNNCNWNIDVACNISIETYTGIVLFANDLTNIVTLDQADTSGCINGNGKTITASGSVRMLRLNTESPSHIILTTDGSTLHYHCSWGARFTANGTITATRFNGYALTVASGKKVTLSGETSNFELSLSSSSSYNVFNSGEIDGDGTLRLCIRVNKTLNLGDISCPVAIEGYPTSTADYTAILGEATHIENELEVLSTNATYTVTLADTSNYGLEVDGLTTLGVRGVMTQGSAEWNFDGGYVQNGASSVFNQGAEIASGDVSVSDGTVNLVNTKTWTCDGDFIRTGATFTTHGLNLIMTKDGSTLSIGQYSERFKFSANVTFAGGTTYVTEVEVDADKTLTLNNSLYAYRSDRAVKVTNLGTIDGPTSLVVFPKSTTATALLALGNISCSVIIRAHSAPSGDVPAQLTAEANLANLTIESASATYSMVVDLNGQTLNASLVTLGIRGTLTGSGTINAPVTVPAGTLNNTGEMTVTGLLTCSGGLIDQDSHIHCYGGVLVSSGTVTGPTNYLVGSFILHDCDFYHSGGTVTGTTVAIKTYGECQVDCSHTLSGFYVTTGSVCTKATTNVISQVIITEEGGELVLGQSCEMRYYSSGIYQNQGKISGAGKTLQLSLYNADKTIEFGDIDCDIRIRALTVATADRTLSLTEEETLPGSITVDSQHTTYKATLDQAGHHLTAKNITASTLGKILGDGGTGYTGDWDTSLGEFDPEGCIVQKLGTGTEKMAAGQSFYDFTAEVNPLDLASDLTISNVYRHARDAVLNGFTLTLTDPTKEEDIFVRKVTLAGSMGGMITWS